MRVTLYIASWIILMVATLLELFLFGIGIDVSLAILGIIGLAALKALIISAFYQHLLHEARGITILYAAGLLAGVGLIAGMVISIMV